MRCVDADELGAFVEGCLSGQALVRVEEHLDVCPECRVTIAALAKARRADALEPASPAAADGRAALPKRGALLSRFVVLDWIGAGGMGLVCSAFDPQLERKVAIKILRPWVAFGESAAQASERLLREARAMARLVHPNVVTVHEVGTVGDQVFLAMELVEGGSLRAWLGCRRRGWRGVRDVLLQAGRGLAAAHAAGVVHGDFKPDNVLVGEDGRARVTDFGLARDLLGADQRVCAGDSGESEAPRDVSTAVNPRASSGLQGTLPYLAPEQRHGGPASCKTDQFGFCVTLYEALYGTLPPSSSPNGATSATPGRAPEMPRRGGVPRFVRGVLGRGLSPDPEQRFPSIDALVAALAKEPLLARRRVRWLAAALVVPLLAVGVLQWNERRALDHCQKASELGAAWNPLLSHAVRASLARSGKPWAQATWRRVDERLGTYAASWAAERAQACRAEPHWGEQRDKTTRARLACLDRQLVDFSALVETFAAGAGDELLDNAVAATWKMDAPARCARALPVAPSRALPNDASAAQRVNELYGQLARLRALGKFGQYAPAREVGTSLEQAARALGHSQLEAEALSELGAAAQGLALYDVATEHFEAAARQFLAVGDDRALALAFSELARTEFERRNNAQSARWADYAAAARQRLGRDDELDARLALTRAYINFASGELPLATRRLEEIIPVVEGAGDQYTLTNAYSLLGSVLGDQGEGERAVQMQQRATEMAVRVFGRETPQASNALNNLATAYANAGRFTESLAVARDCLSLRQELLGPEHPKTAWSHVKVGQALLSLGRDGEALPELQVGVQGVERALGNDSPRLVGPLSLRGQAERALGHASQGIASCQRALSVAEKSSKNPALKAEPLLCIGEAQLALGAAWAAVAPLERAFAVAEESAYADLRALAGLLLARAVWQSRGARAQAKELASAARVQLIKGGVYGRYLADADALLLELGELRSAAVKGP